MAATPWDHGLEREVIPTVDGGRVIAHKIPDTYARDVYATGLIAPIHGLQKPTRRPEVLQRLRIGDVLGVLDDDRLWSLVTADGETAGRATSTGTSALAKLRAAHGDVVVVVTMLRYDAAGAVTNAGGFGLPRVDAGRLVAMVTP